MFSRSSVLLRRRSKRVRNGYPCVLVVIIHAFLLTTVMKRQTTMPDAVVPGARGVLSRTALDQLNNVGLPKFITPSPPLGAMMTNDRFYAKRARTVSLLDGVPKPPSVDSVLSGPSSANYANSVVNHPINTVALKGGMHLTTYKDLPIIASRADTQPTRLTASWCENPSEGMNTGPSSAFKVRYNGNSLGSVHSREAMPLQTFNYYILLEQFRFFVEEMRTVSNREKITRVIRTLGKQIMSKWMFQGICIEEMDTASRLPLGYAMMAQSSEKLINTTISGPAATFDPFSADLPSGTRVFLIAKRILKSDFGDVVHYYTDTLSSNAVEQCAIDSHTQNVNTTLRKMLTHHGFYQLVFYADPRHTEPPLSALEYVDFDGQTRYAEYTYIGWIGDNTNDAMHQLNNNSSITERALPSLANDNNPNNTSSWFDLRNITRKRLISLHVDINGSGIRGTDPEIDFTPKNTKSNRAMRHTHRYFGN